MATFKGAHRLPCEANRKFGGTAGVEANDAVLDRTAREGLEDDPVVRLSGEHGDLTTFGRVDLEIEHQHLSPAGLHVGCARAEASGRLVDACEATDPEVQKAALARHAKHLREHVRTLSAKAYWQQFEQSPDFVVLFLPGEAFFSAALQVDPELLEAGASADVLIATPTTLIALLRAIGCGWRQEDTAREAKEIARLGAELHQRLGVFLRHFDRVRKGIEGAADAYNDAVSSFESRLMPAARKFEELQGAQKPLGEPASVDAPLRKPSLPESETGQ